MIILVIITGLYLISAAGYFKYSKRLARSKEGIPDYLEAMPKTINALLAGMALIWPVWVIGFLAKEASA